MSLTDMEILKEMLSEKRLVRNIKETSSGNNLELIEDNKECSYTMTVIGIPNEDELIVIKTDDNAQQGVNEPEDLFKSFFKCKKDECKRADFILIDTGRKKVIFVEMKLDDDHKNKAKKQLKSLQCLFAYFKEVGRLFWENPNFLENYDNRFVKILRVKNSIHKKNFKYPRKNAEMLNQHNTADKPFTIKDTNQIFYNALLEAINQEYKK